MTLMASLSLGGMGEALILDGAANTQLFESSSEQILAPSLEPGQMVIMDNVSIQKGKKVREIIAARGSQLLFLPASSPDLAPIEEAFSQLKAILRRIGARPREALQEALEDALTTVSASDASGWFSHCGYWQASHQAEKSS
jgi:transposase